MKKPFSNQIAAANKLKLLEVMLWVLGLACLGTYGVSKLQSARAQSAAISSLQSNWQPPVSVEPDQSLWSKARIEHYERSLAKNDGVSTLGLLAIPAVGIQVAVFEGTSDRILNLGVGRVEGTGKLGAKGNLALAGHRDGFFRGLKDIEVGDDISIRHGDGGDKFKVTEVMIVEPDAVHVLEPTDDATLTLVTCYPFYFVGPAPKRFIVKAVSAQADVH